MQKLSKAAQFQALALSIAARSSGDLGLEEPQERQHGHAVAAMLKGLAPGGDLVVLGAGRRLAQLVREQLLVERTAVVVVDPDGARLQQATAALGTREGVTPLEGPLDDLRTDPAQLSQLLASTPASDLRSYRKLEAAVDRLRREHPLVADASRDAVLLDGIASMLSSAQLGSVAKEAFRVLRRGGRLAMCGLLLDERIGGARQGDPVATLPLEQELAEILAAAGYHGITYLWRADLPSRIVDGVEARAFVLEAYKGKQGVCIDQGHAVMYRGPWREVLDDDGHRYARGERTAVCKKTYELLHRAPYQGQFFGLVPYVLVPEDQAPLFDCATPALRAPAITKGTRSVTDAVAAPSSASCEGENCCQPDPADSHRMASSVTEVGNVQGADMEKIEISNAAHEDMGDILRLLEGASLPLEGVSAQSSNFLVARHGGRVLGGVAMETYGSDVLLRSLVVAPDGQRRGVGKQLVSAFLDRARSQATTRVYLMTTTAESFFQKLGFQQIPTESVPAGVRTSEEFGGCSAAGATTMALSLGGAEDERALKEEIRRKYSNVATNVIAPTKSCCAPRAAKTQVTRDLYSTEQATCLPSATQAASRGCGSPTDALGLAPGETVLDLGSGAGADVFLAAQQVGPSGKVYGLDMTPEMLDLARKGQAELGLQNVEFMQGEMENIPLPERSVDAVVSNCVISLVTDKDRVFREIFRVMRPGGRMSISDIVSTDVLPPAIRDDLNLWLGCLGGALLIDEYRAKLEKAGFTNIAIDVKRVYNLEELLTKEVQQEGRDPQQVVAGIRAWGGQVCSASVTASRPAEAALHAPPARETQLDART
jgi:arsenite methyltransferase